jgi:hypothetical protein
VVMRTRDERIRDDVSLSLGIFFRLSHQRQVNHFSSACVRAFAAARSLNQLFTGAYAN